MALAWQSRPLVSFKITRLPPSRLEDYADLWDPRFAGQYSMVGTKTTPSVFTVIAAAAVATGKPFKEAQYLADAAWPKLEALKPNIVNLYGADTCRHSWYRQGTGRDGAVPEYSKYVLAVLT